MNTLPHEALVDNILSWYTLDELEQSIARKCEWLPEITKQLKAYIRTQDHPHLFITIGMDRETAPDSLYQQVKALTPRVTNLIGGIAVMEFIPHPHIHILVDRPERYHKGNTIKVIAKALGITRTTLIDVAIGSKASDYANREAYIRGQKVSEDKMVRVAEDRLIRENYNIPHTICL